MFTLLPLLHQLLLVLQRSRLRSLLVLQRSLLRSLLAQELPQLPWCPALEARAPTRLVALLLPLALRDERLGPLQLHPR